MNWIQLTVSSRPSDVGECVQFQGTWKQSRKCLLLSLTNAFPSNTQASVLIADVQYLCWEMRPYIFTVVYNVCMEGPPQWWDLKKRAGLCVWYFVFSDCVFLKTCLVYFIIEVLFACIAANHLATVGLDWETHLKNLKQMINIEERHKKYM